MRCLWKGTTEFWTNGHRTIPGDPTDITVTYFRNHLTRRAVAMFPPPPNPVVSTEHCRDSRLPAVPQKGRRVVLGKSEPSKVYSSHHGPSGTTESQDAAVEAADPSSQRQDTSSRRKGVDTSWSSPGQVAREREIRVSCAVPSSTTRARSLEPASRPRGNW